MKKSIEDRCNEVYALAATVDAEDVVRARVHSAYMGYHNAKWHEYAEGFTPESILHVDAINFGLAEGMKMYEGFVAERELGEQFDYHVGRKIFVGE